MYSESGKKPKVIIATVITAVMLIGATAATTFSLSTGSVLAYDRNQAKSDINECGNGVAPTNVGCQNTDSQIQGDENSVALTSQQTFPEVTCEECFTNNLTPEQIAILETVGFGSSIAEQCERIATFTPGNLASFLFSLENFLFDIGVDAESVQAVVDCLAEVFGT
jgi:hypothetical protein